MKRLSRSKLWVKTTLPRLCRLMCGRPVAILPRLCRLMCGRPVAFRGKGNNSEGLRPGRSGHSPQYNPARLGKSETCRTSGGRAAILELLRLSIRNLSFVPCVVFALWIYHFSANARQASETKIPALIPILPLLIEYEYAPLSLIQWINDHPQYTMIEAIINQTGTPLYQVILTEKETRRRVYYCNVEAKVKELARDGLEAHLAAIDFKTASNAEGPQGYGLALSDKRGRPVRWRFLPATTPSERGAGLTPLAAAPGLRLEYRDLGTAAGAGSAVQIGDKVSEAAAWPEISSPPYFVAYRGSISLGRHIGALPLGKESWRVISAPVELREGAEWKLVNERGRERALKITARQGDLLTISEAGASSFQPSILTLQTRVTDNGLAIQSVRETSGSQTMRLSFKPELNLAAAPASGNRAETNFQIDQGNVERVAQGMVTLDRQGEALRLRWRPKAPDWARTRVLETTIRLTTAANAIGYTIETTQAR